jgi:hypothetical protein
VLLLTKERQRLSVVGLEGWCRIFSQAFNEFEVLVKNALSCEDLLGLLVDYESLHNAILAQQRAQIHLSRAGDPAKARAPFPTEEEVARLAFSTDDADGLRQKFLQAAEQLKRRVTAPFLRVDLPEGIRSDGVTLMVYGKRMTDKDGYAQSPEALQKKLSEEGAFQSAKGHSKPLLKKNTTFGTMSLNEFCACCAGKEGKVRFSGVWFVLILL